MTHSPEVVDLDNNDNVNIGALSHASWYSDKDGFLIMDFTGVDHHWGNPEVMEVGALTGSGHGNWVGWIWMGRHLETKGNSERNVTFKFSGDMKGVVTAGGGDAEASIKGVVMNKDANSKATTEIASWEKNTIGHKSINRSYTDFLYTELDPNDDYLAYVKVKVKVTSLLGVKAMASSDFGPFDHDPGFVNVDSIYIYK